MRTFRFVRILARVIYHLSGVALVAAIVAIFFSPSLAVILGISAVVGWIIGQVLARVAFSIFIRNGGDPVELELGTWRDS